MKKEHVSASAITKFSDCPAAFLMNYDEDRKVTTRSDRTDVGNLVHGALEEWEDPENNYTGTWEELEACFDRAAEAYTFAETFESYRRGKDILLEAYKMRQSHPTLPVHLMSIVAVEQELLMPCALCGNNPANVYCPSCNDLGWTLWKRPEWSLPMKGAIDRVGIIPTKTRPDGVVEVTLVVGDTKTGRMKSHGELTKEDIQPAIYMLYARDQIVPVIESTGKYVVMRIVAAWEYVTEGEAVAMYESDFDHESTINYVANIAAQITALIEKYNVFMESIGEQEDAEERLNAWLAKYEKPNVYCVYCPRKNVCQTFQRLLTYEAKVDIVGEVDWDKIWEELMAYSAIQKNAESRVKEIREVIPVYLDQEGLSSIPIFGGVKEIIANAQTRKLYRHDDVAEILGDSFVRRNAKFTETSIKAEIALVAKTDPARARELEALLANAYDTIAGPRPVIARNVVEAKPAKKTK